MGILSRLFGQEEVVATDFELVDQEATDEELGLPEGEVVVILEHAVLCGWCQTPIGVSSVADSHGICSSCSDGLRARHRAQRSR